MGLITPLDKFMSNGDEFPDVTQMTDDDLTDLHEMIIDEIGQRGKRSPCR